MLMLIRRSGPTHAGPRVPTYLLEDTTTVLQNLPMKVRACTFAKALILNLAILCDWLRKWPAQSSSEGIPLHKQVIDHQKRKHECRTQHELVGNREKHDLPDIFGELGILM